MVPALVLAAVVATSAAAVQTQTVLHIKVAVKEADGGSTAVPRYLLLVSDIPPTAPPHRVMTTLDGTADVWLRPGRYTIESDQPFVFQGRLYTWTRTLDVVSGRDAVLELTAENADVESAPATTARSSPDTESAMLLANWQGSVVSIWTPTAHGSGFGIDARGLIATSQRVVGTARTVEVQLTPLLKVAGTVLAIDAEHDVAIVWIDAKTSVKPVPPGCGQPGDAGAERKVITIGSTRHQQKRMTTGSMSGRAAHLIPSDLTITPDSAGGPVFALGGPLVGLTARPPEEGDGDARVVPVADVCALLASSEGKLVAAAAPSASPLPVEPPMTLPPDVWKDAAKQRTGSLAPYRMSSSEFDVAFITPAMVYAIENLSDEERRRRSSARSPTLGPAPIDPLENFSNWSGYVAEVPPVLLVRVTPRLTEGFWTKVGRAAASMQGVSLPPIERFKSGFLRLRATCGDIGVTPIHPFRLEQRVSDTDAIYEGLYVFDPGALGPSCRTVKLTFYSEKAPAAGDTRVVDPKIVQQIWDDFARLRETKEKE
jgi:S1-C subfamily serine protease